MRKRPSSRRHRRPTRPWFRCPFGDGHDDPRVLGLLGDLGYRNVHWHVELEDWEPWRAAEDIARDAIDGAGRHGDGAVVLAPHVAGSDGGRASDDRRGVACARVGPRSDRSTPRRGPPVKRPALLAVDAGGSKIDAVLLRRDGNVLGAARRRGLDHDGTGTEGFLERIADAVVAACRDAGVEPESPAGGGAGDVLRRRSRSAGGRPPDRALVPAPRPDRERCGSQRHVRGPSSRHRANVGRRGRVRVRHELLGRRPQRPDLQVPGVRGDLGGLGRGPRHRHRGPLVFGESRGRPRGGDGRFGRWSPSTSGSRGRGS